ncbi:MAG TPA: TonB-dependent receptor [Methylophilaceae bacterium]|nr:TonB-dependent receptor [Methylophilaceae bacterium]
MKQTTIASLIGLLFSHSIFAETTAIQTQDVVVTASRVSQSRESVIADVTVINSEEIERAGQSTFIELLQTQPGIEISSNGGAGKTSSIFMRGTNSNHIVVLVDGIRVNSATAGTTTFENIPLAQIDKIEILRGPATSLYGQDAIGGVIQIFTKQGGGAIRFNAAAGYGSYNTKTAEAGVRGSAGDTKFSLNASSLDTDGFSAKRFRTGIQSDDDGYRNLSFTGSVSHRIAEGHDLGLQIFSSEGRNRYDSSNTFSNYGNLSQLSYSIFSKNQITSFWLSTVRLGEGIDDSVDHSAPNSRSQFKTKQAQYSWQNDFSLPVGTLSLLYDRLEQRVISTTDFDENKRNNDGFTGSYLLNLGAHSFQASYRSDHNTQFGTNDTGGIGYGFSFSPNWRATASYGTAFKAPTFNDLYFPGFSNPDLKPEKSKNAEASLRYESTSNSASLTVYENKIKDLIAFDFGAAPFVFNLNEARIQGLTLAGSQRLDDWLLKGSVDVQSPRDTETDNLLVRRANRHASLNLSRVWGDWRFGSEFIASSARYADAANTERMGGYGVLNLTADYKVNQDWKLQARLNNALDKNYTLVYDTFSDVAYNTPGSNIFVSVRYAPSN